jgi:hypothetical protein
MPTEPSIHAVDRGGRVVTAEGGRPTPTAECPTSMASSYRVVEE